MRRVSESIQMVGVVLMLAGLSCLAGCGMSPRSLASGVAQDVARAHGGFAEDVAQARRAEGLLQALCVCSEVTRELNPRVRVLATDRPIALAVAPRDVFVSQGLLAIASDEQVRAAIAHELGHLAETETGRVSSLVGDPEMACPEARADRFAVELLRQAGHDPAAMHSLLGIMIQHPSTNESLEKHLSHRQGLVAH